MTEAVEKHIKKLQRLDKKDELEVEHLLKVLKTPSKEYIAPLREMAEQWKNDPPPQEGVLFVPYAEWVEAICIYLEEGTRGLIKVLNEQKELFNIAFGVLEEIPISEAFTAFLEIAKTFSTGITDEQEDFIKKYAYSLCCISHQLKSEKASKDLHEAFVPILKQIISFAQSKKNETIMCNATVCFQAFGDKSDIEYLKSLTFTEDYYKNTGKTIIKRIEKKYVN